MRLNENNKVTPLLSWDIYMESYHQTLVDGVKGQILNDLKEYKKNFKWAVDLSEILNSMDFQAVVLTNNKQEIQYASKGFRKLTGYPFNFIKGKSPQILQGENTCFETRARIREHIKKERHFKEEVVNYRKNGGEYKCLISVFPIRDKEGVITHYIALEREV